MKKDDIRNLLIVGKYGPKYYSENIERKDFFLELLGENFPYAIKLFCTSPALFMENWSDYKDKYLKKIWIMYSDNVSGEAKRTLYTESYKNNADFQNVRRTLENEFWKLSTIELLYFYQKCHQENAKDRADIRSFHSECLNKLAKVIKQAEKDKKAAFESLKKAELAFLRADLLSDMVTEEKKQETRKLLKKYAKTAFSVDYLGDICTNYQSKEWVDIYLKAFIDSDVNKDRADSTVAFFNHNLALKTSDDILFALLCKNDQKRIIDIFSKIESIYIFDKLFELYTKEYNKPDIIIALLRLYFKKFPDSGEAIGNAARYVSEGRSSVNDLPEIVEYQAKSWLVGINAHNHTDEICSVIEALKTVNKLEELFYDFAFWKKMETCNAFINVVDGISVIIGFERCYELIRKNYLTANIYEESILKSKWLKAASAIATHYDEAQRAYVFFIGELIDQSSILDARSREILTKETIFNLLQQATENKKLLDLQIKNNSKVKTECLQDVIFYIYPPMEKLEKTLIAYSTMPGSENETLRIFRNMLSKVRASLDEVGIHTLIDISDWEKCKVVAFDPKLHVCTEDVKEGEGVICLSMGMRDDKNGFYEKANVRVYKEEMGDGGNV